MDSLFPLPLTTNFLVLHLFLNGKSDKEKSFIQINKNTSFYDLSNMITEKMNLKNIKRIRLFKQGGIEIFQDDLEYLKNNETIFVSKGEDFDDKTQLMEYDLLKQLGEGGFGRVFLGVHKKTGEKVALKFIKEGFIENTTDISRIFSEASALKNLMHNNIVKIKNFFTLTNMQFIFVMEYLEGGELKEYLTKKGRLNEEEAQWFFRQIVDAIFYCHRQQIIHRDLKLENILLESLESKIIKVVDFGISGFFSNDPTQAGSLKYLPPEVLIDQVSANPGVDIWALGCILYRFTHGYAPFDGSTKAHIVDRIIHNDIVICPIVEKEVSLECIDLLKRMLTKDPKDRINMLEVSNHIWLKSNINDLQIKKEEKKAKVYFTLTDDGSPNKFSEENEEKTLFSKSMAAEQTKSKFRIKKDQFFRDIEVNTKSLRKYTTNSPDLKKKYMGRGERESIDKFENNNNVKLPALYNSPMFMKKSPLIKSVVNENMHSKSLSPTKLRPHLGEKHLDYSKMYLPKLQKFN